LSGPPTCSSQSKYALASALNSSNPIATLEPVVSEQSNLIWEEKPFQHRVGHPTTFSTPHSPPLHLPRLPQHYSPPSWPPTMPALWSSLFKPASSPEAEKREESSEALPLAPLPAVPAPEDVLAHDGRPPRIFYADCNQSFEASQ
jgi:hypothetical protein